MLNMESQPQYGRILKTVRSDIPWCPLTARRGQVFPLVFNANGAAAALFGNGDTLGLKPDEYEPAEAWKE